MADISKIKLPGDNTEYNLKDALARTQIAQISTEISGSMSFLGVTTTALIDGSTTNPIVINGNNVTATAGAVVIYGDKEFIFSSDSTWHELGDTGDLGALAWKDSATGTVTPTGNVSAPTFTGTSTTANVSVTGAGTISITTATGTANYTPAGSVSAPSVTVTPNTSSFTGISSVGTLPSFSATVSNEILTLSFSQGTLPSAAAATTVVTGIASATAGTPSFTGTGVRLTGSFTGTAVSTSFSYTATGTVSQPTFTGTSTTITVS